MFNRLKSGINLITGGFAHLHDIDAPCLSLLGRLRDPARPKERLYPLRVINTPDSKKDICLYKTPSKFQRARPTTG